MKKQIGIDVAKKTLDVCYLEDITTGQHTRKVFDNSDRGHKQLIEWLKAVSSVSLKQIRVTLEATGVYHLKLAHLLKAKQVYICVINPLQAHHYAKGLGMRAKTDKLDSLMLARYGWERKPAKWQPPSKERIELKALNLRLDALEKDIRRERNRLESAEIAAQSKQVVRLIKKSIRSLERQVKEVVDLIDKQIESHKDLKKDQKLLLSIKGIGDVCSRYLVAEIYRGRFDSASQCAAYMGLVPVPQESGNYRKVGLSRAGNRKLKAKLYMAAISAKQHNPIIKQHYDRMIAKGKCKMSALCGAMRRLIHICFGVIKHQKEFCLQAV